MTNLFLNRNIMFSILMSICVITHISLRRKSSFSKRILQRKNRKPDCMVDLSILLAWCIKNLIPQFILFPKLLSKSLSVMGDGQFILYLILLIVGLTTVFGRRSILLEQ